ncbi:hypothetical protein XpopCFBP1817_14880 [Xanthomonas populi]|uniref:Uncharacterized protein n=2 Tax=Xanthomonas populi TaxID=53414 RepID=A0A2S7ELU1_9XANT|nr:hypothetical protein XpopCFBP1817_14880 [Xanthomonas populi]
MCAIRRFAGQLRPCRQGRSCPHSAGLVWMRARQLRPKLRPKLLPKLLPKLRRLPDCLQQGLQDAA